MTVPVVGSLARKPPWRYLPEIHASRLSISGSMRPKLGLFILCILLLLSVVALLVPLLTKIYSKSTSGSVKTQSESVLSEYVRHVWTHATASGSLMFSPAGVSHLITVLSSLNSKDDNVLDVGKEDIMGSKITDDQMAVMNTKSGVNHAVRFHVSSKTIYDDIVYKMNRSNNVEVKLVNVNPSQETKDSNEKMAVIASHQMKLTFDNMKLTEEKYYMSPGVSKRVVMYDIVGPADVLRLDTETVYKLTDVNNLTLTLVLPRIAGTSPEYIIRTVDKYLHFNSNKFKRRNVRLRFPIITTEKVTQLGPVMRYLHHLPETARRQHALSEPLLPDRLDGQSPAGRQARLMHLVISLLNKNSNISHLASLQISKGADTVFRSVRVPEIAVFDHKFVFAVTSPSSQLPLILGVFDIQE